jgi:hypothetical protein
VLKKIFFLDRQRWRRLQVRHVRARRRRSPGPRPLVHAARRGRQRLRPFHRDLRQGRKDQVRVIRDSFTKIGQIFRTNFSDKFFGQIFRTNFSDKFFGQIFLSET